jgi:transcriptional regulator with XRE-family HTH domain
MRPPAQPLPEVEWPSAEVGIATEALYALVHGLDRPTTLDQAHDNELRVSLRQLRETLGKTQADLAGVAGRTQGALSQFESAPDHKLSALRKYLAALDCELECCGQWRPSISATWRLGGRLTVARDDSDRVVENGEGRVRRRARHRSPLPGSSDNLGARSTRALDLATKSRT